MTRKVRLHDECNLSYVDMNFKLNDFQNKQFIFIFFICHQSCL